MLVNFSYISTGTRNAKANVEAPAGWDDYMADVFKPEAPQETPIF